MLKLRVRSITYEADGILSFELVSPSGEPLPRFEAGAHIDVKIPGGLSRRYSLCNSPSGTECYRIAVLNVPGGRGGSKAMHERVRPGDMIEVSEPHNFFPMADGASHTVLLAGGIGITPMLAMMATLVLQEQSWELHYCTRDASRTAFRQLLADAQLANRVTLHHDEGDPCKGLNIADLLQTRAPGTHVYFCGPPGFMSAVQSATSHWPRDAVHFEYFGAEPKAVDPSDAPRSPSSLVLSRTGRVIDINVGQTMLQALRSAGVECESSCEAGVCGACKIGYTSGTPEHNDYVLGDDERASQVLVCCARVLEGPVVLDI